MVDGSTREVTSKWSLVPSFPPGHHCCHGNIHYDHLSNVFTFTFSYSCFGHEDFPGHHNVVMGTSTHTTAIIADGEQYQELASETKTFCADKLISLIFYRHSPTLSSK